MHDGWWTDENVKASKVCLARTFLGDDVPAYLRFASSKGRLDRHLALRVDYRRALHVLPAYVVA